MVAAIRIETDDVIGIEEFCETIEDNFDFSDREQLPAAAPLLRKLSNNKDLFRKAALDTLKAVLEKPQINVTPASMVLSPARHSSFLVRANLWPVLRPGAPQSTRETFSYDLKHDHTFSFATTNYFGPGYRTDIWQNPAASRRALNVGDVADLSYQGEFLLADGLVLCFDRLTDVHVQHPPEADSVSLNLVVSESQEYSLPQHVFARDSGEVIGYPNGSPLRNKLIFTKLLSASEDPEIAEVVGWATRRVDCDVHRAALQEAHTRITDRISK